MKDNTGQVCAGAVGDRQLLLNEKRHALAEIERGTARRW